jgi:hypothetical protein
MQEAELREIEWAPPKESPPVLLPVEDPPEEYGPWQWAAAFGRATGRFGADAFTLQGNGTLRCPAGATLWLSEVRQENAFTQRAVYLAYQTDCQRCSLREQCLASGAKGDRARRVRAVRRLLPPPASVERKPVVLGPMRWVDVAGRALRRTWTTHWRGQFVEVLALTEISKSVPLPLAHRVRCVRITVGVGKIGSHAMPGGDHPNYASRLLAFPHSSPATNTGGTGKQRSFFYDVSSPL